MSLILFENMIEHTIFETRIRFFACPPTGGSAQNDSYLRF